MEARLHPGIGGFRAWMSQRSETRAGWLGGVLGSVAVEEGEAGGRGRDQRSSPVRSMGRVNQKVLPWPDTLLTPTAPP